MMEKISKDSVEDSEGNEVEQASLIQYIYMLIQEPEGRPLKLGSYQV